MKSADQFAGGPRDKKIFFLIIYRPGGSIKCPGGTTVATGRYTGIRGQVTLE